jgi:DNA polymerase III epsilon subunit-like protein
MKLPPKGKPKGLDAFAEAAGLSFQPRQCRICVSTFTPPRNPGQLSTDNNQREVCPGCRRAVKDSTLSLASPGELPALHSGPGAPMRQVVFDLETWGLDRGWGVTLVASFLIHGDPEGPKKITLLHRDSAAWKAGKRSDDREIAEETFRILNRCHIAYAHNGDRFDIKWLRTVALKHELQMPRIKLVDPCSVAWKRYLLGRNSLDAVADFLGLSDKKDAAGRPLEKMHIGPDVWRGALMDDNDECWRLLSERCVSDVVLLNEVAARVTGDVGMVDFQGSWR